MRGNDFKRLKIIIDLEANSIQLLTMSGKKVGFSRWFIEKDNMYIEDFGIENEFRGKGYGSFLARVMFDLARLFQMKTLSLTDGSTLDDFWQRLGFKWDSRRDHHILKL